MSDADLPQVAPLGVAGRVGQAQRQGQAHVAPGVVLMGAQAGATSLPVCDHYCGVEARMRKSLALQAEMTQELGACVFDVTLDCEDGAPVGGESDHANMVVSLVKQAFVGMKTRALRGATGVLAPRIAVRLHALDHAAFEQDVDVIVGGAAQALCHVMIPKVESVADVDRAARAIDAAASRAGRTSPLPLHVLIESAHAVRQAFDIAAHPRVQSLSFGLMDFVSSHAGAIPASAMGVDATGLGNGLDQFSHPLVVRAKLEIASACHAFGKTPSHCVVTEFNDPARLRAAASHAAQALGYTRMWSIHPSQIRPIVEALAPSEREVDKAAQILLAAQQAQWAPISFESQLHDRASYRYYWQLLERAQRTGRPIPALAQDFFSAHSH